MLGKERVEALASQAAAEGRSVLDYFSILRSLLFSRLDAASAAGDDERVAKLVVPLLQTLKQMGRISGELGEMAARNITVNNVAVTNVNILKSEPIVDLQRGLLETVQHSSQRPQRRLELVQKLDAKYSQPVLPGPAMREVNGAAVSPPQTIGAP